MRSYFSGNTIIFFHVQLTTNRIGNLTRLIHTLLYVMTIHTYIHTYLYASAFISRTYVHELKPSYLLFIIIICDV